MRGILTVITGLIGNALVVMFVVGWVVSTAAIIHDHWTEFRRERKIRAAQKMELAEGVSREEGTKALFYGDVHWGAAWGKGYNYVDFMAGVWSGPKATMRVHLDTGRMESMNFRRERGPEGKNEPNALTDAMIQAVREKQERQ